MYKSKRVSVVIPTYNEALSIRDIIDRFFATGVVDEVVVVDNNALGNTKEEVSKTKALLVHESKQGYGFALMRGLNEAKGDLIVMCEADGTSDPEDIHKFLIYSENFPVVLSTRTSRAAIFSGAFMPFPVRFGNWFWAKIVGVLFNGPSMSDIGCTYKLINRESLEKIKDLFPLSDGDGKFSPEFIIWVIQRGIKPIEIPVMFRPRIGESMYTGSVWKAAKLGFKELIMIIKYRFKNISEGEHKEGKKCFLKKYGQEILSFGLTFLSTISVFVWSSLRFSNDDQFILYRYIENISLGNGFVYNLGDKVLGATTPLFTLIAGLFAFVFKNISVPNVVACLNIFFISVAGVFVYKIAKKYISSGLSKILVLMFALSMSKIVPEGMESSLFILTSFVSLYYLLNAEYKKSSIFVALAILTRPDAVIVGLIYFLYWWQKKDIKFAIRMSSIAILIALPWLIFATIYFGSFIPQSLIAKMHTSDIVNQSSIQALKVQLAYLSRMYWGKIFDPNNILVQTILNLLPVVFLVSVSFVNKCNKDNWPIFAIPFSYFALFNLSNPVMFPWYLTQMETFWVIISFFGFSVLYNKFFNKNILVKILVFVLVLSGSFYVWFNLITTKDKGSKIPLFKMSEFIIKNSKPDERVGVNNIGIIGFQTKRPLVDFFGLTTDYSPYFYPVKSCSDKTVQYQIPDELIIYSKPDILVLSGKDEVTSCFKESRWFKENYRLVFDDYGFIYRLKK